MISNMGNVEDVRKVIQDFVAPDMKAIAVRIEALECEMNVRFTSTDQRIASLDKEMNLRFNAAEQLAASRHENVMNAMNAHHSTIMNSLEMEKRLARLESDRARLSSSSQEQ